MKIGTCALIIHPYTSKVFVVSRKNNPNQFSMPGGKLEEGEEIVDGFIRELREETGIICVPSPGTKTPRVKFGLQEKYFFPFYSGKEIDDFETHCFIMSPFSHIHNQHFSMEEGVLYRWITWDQMCDPEISPFWNFNKKCKEKLDRLEF